MQEEKVLLILSIASVKSTEPGADVPLIPGVDEYRNSMKCALCGKEITHPDITANRVLEGASV